MGRAHPGPATLENTMLNHRSTEVSAFLKSRRARVSPGELGFSAERRRVPGLRREEVATRANLSVDYYTRLEQGRALNPTPEVLQAVSKALLLEPDEYVYFSGLFAQPKPPPAQELRPQLNWILDALPLAPAVVLNADLDVLGVNQAARVLIADFDTMDEPNFARFVFADPKAKVSYVDWRTKAENITGMLRYGMPGNPSLGQLSDELCEQSPAFRKLWSDHTVQEKTFGPMRLRHPDGEALDTHFQHLYVAGDQGVSISVYSPPTGSPSADRIRELLS
ncbi:helix-turn-helix domain-containing protein [Kineosporia babensis]|uniref:Helix-turn-helix transcriptional regulator n=1 Tax=Kineosporia babensis TaxID=499548 RepID=A0A9X1SYJ3_9ACTN|nr:helix-turn-helix domain-containing protein [Kineosporia babensis]MCD5316989.1 helix-turn-helix transcriptional regulator [Kineosporia babensis]